jgi:hypothetical protein
MMGLVSTEFFNEIQLEKLEERKNYLKQLELFEFSVILTKKVDELKKKFIELNNEREEKIKKLDLEIKNKLSELKSSSRRKKIADDNNSEFEEMNVVLSDQLSSNSQLNTPSKKEDSKKKSTSLLSSTLKGQTKEKTGVKGSKLQQSDNLQDSENSSPLITEASIEIDRIKQIEEDDDEYKTKKLQIFLPESIIYRLLKFRLNQNDIIDGNGVIFDDLMCKKYYCDNFDSNILSLRAALNYSSILQCLYIFIFIFYD